MGASDDFSARLRAARELAPSLVGLPAAEALEAAVREGYPRSQVVTPDVDALTAELDSLRIRLFVDEHDVVVRATAG
jgi:hypothetical protein